MAKKIIPFEKSLFSIIADRPHRADAEYRIVAHIRKGFKWAEVKRFQEAFDIKDEAFAHIIGVSGRTLTRTKKRSAAFDPVASDRLYRLAKVLELAATVFEDQPRAVRWLQREQPGLSGRVPLQLLDTDPGTEQVETLLRQLEYGVLP